MYFVESKLNYTFGYEYSKSYVLFFDTYINYRVQILRYLTKKCFVII